MVLIEILRASRVDVKKLEKQEAKLRVRDRPTHGRVFVDNRMSP